jgi:hypothetical protein
MSQRRSVISAILLIAVAAGGAYYYFYSRRYVYRFTEAQLQEALSQRLPFTKTYLLIFQVTLDHPRVNLANGSDRVQAGLDITLNVHMADDRSAIGGSIDASGGIRYDPKVGQLFLTQPKIERLELQGAPEQYTSRASAAISKALDTYCADHAIYTLNTSRAKEVAARLVLKSVTVEEHQLVVTLGIGN